MRSKRPVGSESGGKRGEARPVVFAWSVMVVTWMEHMKNSRLRRRALSSWVLGDATR